MLARKKPAEEIVSDEERIVVRVEKKAELANEKPLQTEVNEVSADSVDSEDDEPYEESEANSDEEELMPFVPSVVKHVLISAAAILFILVGAGLAYTYFMGGSDQTTPVLAAPVAATVNSGEIKPHTPSPKAPESAAVQLLTTPVRLGEQASMSVKTQPGSSCTISVEYNHVKSTAAGLVKKTADDFGSVTWDWKIAKTTPEGSWPVIVTCTFHGRAAVVQADLLVTT